jgi:phage terminase large subunit
MADLQTNSVFRHLSQSNKKYVIEQGGTRSGKTYNILIWLIHYLGNNEGKVVTICRKSFPSLRGSVYRDFIEIMMKAGRYNEAHHNKTEHIYRFGSNLVEFIAIDQPQKIRGRKRNLLFINEANELNYEEFFQLDIRTTERVIIDYNPSEEFWVDRLRQEEDCDFFITTYKNNPFLPKDLVSKIERLKDQDENYWRVYGLGLKGYIEGQVFSNYTQVDKFPECKWVAYGLDFGYTNDPTALIKVGMSGGEMYFEELIYETGLTNQDIGKRLKELGIDRRAELVCDSAEPKSIEEIYRMGFNAHGVVKGADSIKNGIDILKRYKINIINPSPNILKEVKNYKWQKDKNGNFLNKPIDFYNHACDAMRYVALHKLKIENKGKYILG